MTLTSGNRDLTQPWVRDLTHSWVNSTVGSNVRYNVEKSFFLLMTVVYLDFIKLVLLVVNTMFLNTVKNMFLE